MNIDLILKDFEIFYRWGQCALQWQSPYTCGDMVYPLPIIVLFAPFALLPLRIAKFAWFSLSLVAFVYALKRRSLLFALFIPVVQAFYYGQVDLLLLPALASGSGIGVAFLTLKPQLAFLWAPIWFWNAPIAERWRFLAVSFAIWFGSLLFHPTWPIHFLIGTRSLAQTAYASPSLWGGGNPWWLVIPSGVALIYFAKDKFAATTTVNPAINAYDLSMLSLNAPWWIVPASWVAFYISQQMGSVWAYAGISAIIATNSMDWGATNFHRIGKQLIPSIFVKRDN